jgi:hypothetical protein
VASTSNPLIGRRYVYYGWLDDVVERYPFSQTQSYDGIVRELVLFAIYDKPVLLNDGYLVTNKWVLKELDNLATGLIGNLLSNKFARVFSRHQSDSMDLAAGIERNASNINTHREIVRDKARWRGIRDNLEALSFDIRPWMVSWPKSKDTSRIFGRFIDAVIDSDAAEARIMGGDGDRFLFARQLLTELKNSRGAAYYSGLRSNIEDQLWTALAREKPDYYDVANLKRHSQYRAIASIMRGINEIYHYAYATAALARLKEDVQTQINITQSPGLKNIDVQGVSVATSTSLCMPSLLESGPGLADEPFDRRALQLIDQLVVTLGDIRFTGDFTFVRHFLFDREFREIRDAYVDTLDAFARGGERMEKAQRRQKEFIESLSSILGPYAAHPKKGIGIIAKVAELGIHAAGHELTLISSLLSALGGSIVLEGLCLCFR